MGAQPPAGSTSAPEVPPGGTRGTGSPDCPGSASRARGLLCLSVLARSWSKEGSERSLTLEIWLSGQQALIGAQVLDMAAWPAIVEPRIRGL